MTVVAIGLGSGEIIATPIPIPIGIGIGIGIGVEIGIGIGTRKKKRIKRGTSRGHQYHETRLGECAGQDQGPGFGWGSDVRVWAGFRRFGFGFGVSKVRIRVTPT